jgi:hypothetical protein
MPNLEGLKKLWDDFEAQKQPTIEGMRELFIQIVKLQTRVLALDEILISFIAEAKGVETKEIFDELDKKYDEWWKTLSAFYPNIL